MLSPLQTERSRYCAGVTLLELLFSMVLLVVITLLLFYGSQALEQGRMNSRCVSNLRQLAVLVLQYSAEHNGDLLPALANESPKGGTPWYMLLDRTGMLPGRPENGGWNRLRSSIMTCPAREDVPLWSGNSAGATLHYGMSQLPGFLNRTGEAGTSFEINYRNRHGYPKLSKIRNPSRTLMLGEIKNAYMIQHHMDERNAYPHGRAPSGMNVAFYDGHVAFFKKSLPALISAGGSYVAFSASRFEPEESYPFF